MFAALVGALSWLGKSVVAALLWSYGRRTREIEMLIALGAEIETAVASLADYATPQVAERFREEIARDPAYRIFAPLDRSYFIFDTIQPNISQLPEAPIRHVVRFYDGIGGFDTLLAAFQEERFERLGADRRIAYFEHMVAAATSIRNDGHEAMNALAASRREVVKTKNAASAAFAVAAVLIAAALYYLVGQAVSLCTAPA